MASGTGWRCPTDQTTTITYNMHTGGVTQHTTSWPVSYFGHQGQGADTPSSTPSDAWRMAQNQHKIQSELRKSKEASRAEQQEKIQMYHKMKNIAHAEAQRRRQKQKQIHDDEINIARERARLERTNMTSHIPDHYALSAWVDKLRIMYEEEKKLRIMHEKEEKLRGGVKLCM